MSEYDKRQPRRVTEFDNIANLEFALEDLYMRSAFRYLDSQCTFLIESYFVIKASVPA